MQALANPYVISALLATAAGLLLYAFLAPRNMDSFAPNLPEAAKKQRLLRAMMVFAGEVYSTLPQGMTYHRNKRDERLEALLVRSGNPWGLTANEFRFMRVAAAVLGFIAGWVLVGLLSLANVAAPWYFVVPACALFGFFIPKMKYNSMAKQRDFDFKRQLPEALDLIIISLSGGMTFSEALRQSIPNMKDGVLKDEFREVMNNVDTGRTVNDSLEMFSKRAPNEGIRTFVQAVKEANELNTPMVEVLEARAQASRDEFFALLHSKTAQLASKMGAVLAPTLLSALLIILLAPSIGSLLSSLN